MTERAKVWFAIGAASAIVVGAVAWRHLDSIVFFGLVLWRYTGGWLTPWRS